MNNQLYDISTYYDPNPQYPYHDNPIPRWTVEIKIKKHYKIKNSPMVLSFCYLDLTTAQKFEQLCVNILEEYFIKVKKAFCKHDTFKLESTLASLCPDHIDHSYVHYTLK